MCSKPPTLVLLHSVLGSYLTSVPVQSSNFNLVDIFFWLILQCWESHCIIPKCCLQPFNERTTPNRCWPPWKFWIVVIGGQMELQICPALCAVQEGNKVEFYLSRLSVLQQLRCEASTLSWVSGFTIQSPRVDALRYTTELQLYPAKNT